MSKEKLERYLIEKGAIGARILTFNKPTMTVNEAEEQLGVSREKIVKTVVFVDEYGTPVVGIVTGDKSVDKEKLAMACGVKKVKIARPNIVKSLVGYEAGATPPVGFEKHVKVFIDPKVLSFDKVYGGGGEVNALLEISPLEIKRLNNGKVADISK